MKDIITRALIYAAEKHSGQTRNGFSVYIEGSAMPADPRDLQPYTPQEREKIKDLPEMRRARGEGTDRGDGGLHLQEEGHGMVPDRGSVIRIR